MPLFALHFFSSIVCALLVSVSESAAVGKSVVKWHLLVSSLQRVPPYKSEFGSVNNLLWLRYDPGGQWAEGVDGPMYPSASLTITVE